MGWHFKHSIKILPGIRLNFGKAGFTSSTIGGKFFKTNLSDKGVKHTLSAPGTGISYTTQPYAPSANNFQSYGNTSVWAIILAVILAIIVVLASAAIVLDTPSFDPKVFTPSPESFRPNAPMQSDPISIVTDSPRISKNSAFVIANSAKIRKTPTANGEVIETILFGTGLQVIKKKGSWLFVNHEGETGWVESQSIKHSDNGIQTSSLGNYSDQKLGQTSTRDFLIPYRLPTPSYSPPSYSSPSYSIPSSPSSGSKTVYVHGYTRKNGTYVAPYSRRASRR